MHTSINFAMELLVGFTNIYPFFLYNLFTCCIVAEKENHQSPHSKVKIHHFVNVHKLGSPFKPFKMRSSQSEPVQCVHHKMLRHDEIKNENVFRRAFEFTRNRSGRQ